MAWTDEELASLAGAQAKAEANGTTRAELIDAAEVYAACLILGPVRSAV